MDRKKPNSEYKWQTRVSGALLSALAITGLAACSNDDTKADGPTSSPPVATETAPSTTTQDITTSPNPTIESSAPTSEVETPDTSMGISAERYKTPEQIGERFGQIIDQWHNSGSTSEIMDTAIHSDNTVEQVSDEAASKLDKEYVAAVFTPEASSDPKTAAAISGIEKSHQDTLYRKTLTTDSSDYRDKEPYLRKLEVISVTPISSDSTTITMTVKYHESDNPDMNRIGSEYGAGKLDEVVSVNLTLTNTSGQWLVAKASYATPGQQ